MAVSPESIPGAERILVRSEPVWRAFAAVSSFARAAAVLAPWADTGSRIGGPAVAGTFFAAASSGATARWATRGRTLIGRTFFRVISLDASQVHQAQEKRGVAVMTSDGRSLALTGESKQIGAWLTRHRTAREAARIRAWLLEQTGTCAPAVEGPESRVRWSTLGGMVLAALLAPAGAAVVEFIG